MFIYVFALTGATQIKGHHLKFTIPHTLCGNPLQALRAMSASPAVSQSPASRGGFPLAAGDEVEDQLRFSMWLDWPSALRMATTHWYFILFVFCCMLLCFYCYEFSYVLFTVGYLLVFIGYLCFVVSCFRF